MGIGAPDVSGWGCKGLLQIQQSKEALTHKQLRNNFCKDQLSNIEYSWMSEEATAKYNESAQ